MGQPVGIVRLVLGVWIAIWLGLWFFGVRDAFWPPWPWKTHCQQLFEKYSGDIYDDGENVVGPASIMEELDDEGCIALDE
jgi:hypothetical protein